MSSEPTTLNKPPTEQVQDLFERIAPVYDQLNDWLSLGLHRVWKQMAVKWSGAKPGDHCLDLCCGSGDLALELARRVRPGGQVWGVDFASAQLAIARQRHQQPSNVNLSISWMLGDVLNLPFDDDRFDAATIGYGLRNVENISHCLQELYRVLRPQAKAAVLDFHRPDWPWMQTFQQCYLEWVVVPISQQMGYGPDYAYLWPSLLRFPQGKAQVALAKAAGFQSAIHYPIAGGTMGVLVVTK